MTTHAFVSASAKSAEIRVYNAYDLKESLKARGYRFNGAGKNGAPLRNSEKAWAVFIETANLIAELDFLFDLGVALPNADDVIARLKDGGLDILPAA